jgi:hypothetical protein
MAVEWLLHRCVAAEGFHYHERGVAATFIAERPYLLASLGFANALSVPAHGEAWRDYLSRWFPELPPVEKRREVLVDHVRHGGRWGLAGVIGDNNAHPDLELSLQLVDGSGRAMVIPTWPWLASLFQASEGFDADAHTVAWADGEPVRWMEDTTAWVAAVSARALIERLYQGEMSLADLTPSEFEDVVSEVITAFDLAVRRTARTGDGGRDLVITGELLPGVKTTMVVEVTTESPTRVDKTRNAIFANRHVPQTVIVSRDRYSAGVVKLAEDR